MRPRLTGGGKPPCENWPGDLGAVKSCLCFLASSSSFLVNHALDRQLDRGALFSLRGTKAGYIYEL